MAAEAFVYYKVTLALAFTRICAHTSEGEQLISDTPKSIRYRAGGECYTGSAGFSVLTLRTIRPHSKSLSLFRNDLLGIRGLRGYIFLTMAAHLTQNIKVSRH